MSWWRGYRGGAALAVMLVSLFTAACTGDGGGTEAARRAATSSSLPKNAQPAPRSTTDTTCLNSNDVASMFSTASEAGGQLWVETVTLPPCLHSGDRVAGLVVERRDPATGRVLNTFTLDPAAIGTRVGIVQGGTSFGPPPAVESWPAPPKIDAFTAWFALVDESRLVGVDPSDGAILSRIAVPADLRMFETVNGKAFGIRDAGNVPRPPPTLTRVDLATGAVDEITLPAVPDQIEAGNGALYVRLPPNDGSGFDTVARVNPATGAVTELQDLSLPIVDIAAAPGALWAIATGSTATVVRIDPVSGRPLTNMTLGGSDATTTAFGSLVAGPRGVFVAASQTINGFVAPRQWWVDKSGKVTEVPFDPKLNPVVGIFDDRLVTVSDGQVVSSPLPK
jgi:hypothetical protein